MAEFPVMQLRIGKVYRYQDGLLEVDGDDLILRVLQDPRIETAKLDVVNPGEAVRVTGIRDVVEPRVKFGWQRAGFSRCVGAGNRGRRRIDASPLRHGGACHRGL